MLAAESLVVAIDGPAGVGKSTTARALAERLGVPYLDTGAMYRAVALVVMEQGVNPDDREAVTSLARSARLALVQTERGQVEVRLEGRSVESRIRTPAVGIVTSKISVHPGVRRRLVELQREAASRFGAVVEGRDIGTVVFPDTPHKFFLTADSSERARRRVEQLRRSGRQVDLREIEAEILDRDRRDQQREDSPMTVDDSYAVIDSTDLGPEQVLERMLEAIRAKCRLA